MSNCRIQSVSAARGTVTKPEVKFAPDGQTTIRIAIASTPNYKRPPSLLSRRIASFHLPLVVGLGEPGRKNTVGTQRRARANAAALRPLA